MLILVSYMPLIFEEEFLRKKMHFLVSDTVKKIMKTSQNNEYLETI